jgi:cytochrome P450
MNALYASFLTGIRSRRSASGSRGSLMDKVLDQVESEKAAPGMTYSDHELWFLGGTLTEGGSDTSASIITAFVQAMVANPDVQRKAQAEIDRVIGAERSPTWEDYAALPYVGTFSRTELVQEIQSAMLTDHSPMRQRNHALAPRNTPSIPTRSIPRRLGRRLPATKRHNRHHQRLGNAT